jgi:uncharacterized protein (TIGR00369 family)
MKRLLLEDDGYCFVCGKQNGSGLGLDFSYQDGKAFCRFIPGKAHQGFKDIVHGGVITAVLDEAMMKIALAQGVEAVTAEVSVRFRNPLMVGDRSLVEAWIEKSGRKLIEAAARMKNADDTIIAEASSKLMKNA